jgi:DNA-binding FadR family transcriptional regulator
MTAPTARSGIEPEGPTGAAASLAVPARSPLPGGRAPWKAIPIAAIQPRRMYERIAEQIHQLISERNLKPGDRLPPERELAAQLNVSRPSVREAMIALETAGYIEVLTGSGTYIRKVGGDASDALWARLHDVGPGVREQFQARKLIEPELAALACETISEVEIDALEAACDRADLHFRRDRRRTDEDDYDFHVPLAQASGNSVLGGLIVYLWDLRGHEMWRTVRERVCRPEHHERILADRRAVIAALRQRDARAARTAMAHYMKNAEKVYFG